jgi:hypothetical protein
MEEPQVADNIRALSVAHGESVSEIMRRVIEVGLPVVSDDLAAKFPSEAKTFPRHLRAVRAKRVEAAKRREVAA